MEDIGFELDSDRPIEFNNKKKPAEAQKKEDPFAKKAMDKDDGLIVDNDFGDDFEDDYYQEDFEDDKLKKASAKPVVQLEEDIFNKSQSKDPKKQPD